MTPLIHCFACRFVRCGACLAACGAVVIRTRRLPARPGRPPAVGPAPTCTGAESHFQSLADASVAVGKAAGAVLAGCSGAVESTCNGRKPRGHRYALISAQIASDQFEPPAPACTRFSVTFVDAAGGAADRKCERQRGGARRQPLRCWCGSITLYAQGGNVSSARVAGIGRPVKPTHGPRSAGRR